MNKYQPKPLKDHMTREQILATGHTLEYLQENHPRILEKASVAYRNMLTRVGSKMKGYERTTISEEWLNNRNAFVLWYLANYPYHLPKDTRICLDKDMKSSILYATGEGASVYSPSTCILITNTVNRAIGSLSNTYLTPSIIRIKNTYRTKINGVYYYNRDRKILQSFAITQKMRVVFQSLEDAGMMTQENAFYISLMYTNQLLAMFEENE